MTFILLFCAERICAEAVATRRSFGAPPNNQPDVADNGERNQNPPSGSIDVVKTPRRNGDTRHEQGQVADGDRAQSFLS